VQTLVTLRLSTLSNRLFWALLTAALAIRLILIITSFGSTDALLTMSWAHLSERFGIGPAYHVTPNLNHPPLSSLYMVAADRLGSRVGLEYPDMFRIFQVIADIITAAILWRLTRNREAVAFFFASPAAMFLSGFHCNADPTMIALLVAAVWMHSGGLLGVASGIKIAPIPLTPFFLIDLTWRRRLTFLLAFGIVLAAIFIPALITGGPVVLHNVFGGGGIAGDGVGGSVDLVTVSLEQDAKRGQIFFSQTLYKFLICFRHRHSLGLSKTCRLLCNCGECGQCVRLDAKTTLA